MVRHAIELVRPARTQHAFALVAGFLALCLSLWLYKSTDFKDFVYSGNINDNTAQRLGQFGDYLGGTLNPLFGLLSIAILSLTLKKQIDRNRRQDFDNHLFTLISLYNSVLQSIDKHDNTRGEMRHWKGRDCFLFMYRNICNAEKTRKLTTAQAYEDFHTRHGWEVCHYYRTVYHMFKHVKDGQACGVIKSEEAKKYRDLIKSQLSAPELALLEMSNNSRYRGNWSEVISKEELFEHLTDQTRQSMTASVEAPEEAVSPDSEAKA